MILVTVEVTTRSGGLTVIGRIGAQNISPEMNPALYRVAYYDGTGQKIRDGEVEHDRDDGAWALIERAMEVLELGVEDL